MGDSLSKIIKRRRLIKTRRRLPAPLSLALALALYLAGAGGVCVSWAQEINTAATTESDVERLRGLLLRYQGDGSTELEADPPVTDLSLEPSLESKESDFAAALAAPYSPDKVLLGPQDLPMLLAEVEERLVDSEVADRRNNASLIGTIQIRQGGTLIGSNRYSLTPIGKHQFFGYTEFGEGRNILGVNDAQWEIELPPPVGTERYLLLLVAPPGEDWELHVIPASATGQLGEDRPQWLIESSGEASPTP
ncbi:hypothetical protein NOR53_1332 [gamma proteobacterium NOR5-3]|nr:hypothetical protein NOR53_1332 [gamma proteobacterium NOR5-3]